MYTAEDVEKDAGAMLEAKKAIDAALGALDKLGKIAAIVKDVEDVVGQPGLPCPVQSQTAVGAIQEILGMRKDTDFPMSPEPDRAVMSLGNGPYLPSIVPIAGGKAKWTSEKTYDTEEEAAAAIIVMAKSFNMRIDLVSSHWITSKREHMIDFGSHSFYGRIVARKGRNVKHR